MDIDGANQTPLTAGPADFPASSPDSRWVFYVAYESVIPTIWRVSIDGGQPVRITDKASTAPVLSPDGKQVACYFQDRPGVWSLAILPFDGGQPVKVFSLPDVKGPALRFTPDGRALVYPITREGVTNLWEQSLDGSPPRQLTDFKSDGVFYFDFSRDGKQLALVRGSRTRDGVLISDLWK
jgi:Tol biopolymer transport system component